MEYKALEKYKALVEQRKEKAKAKKAEKKKREKEKERERKKEETRKRRLKKKRDAYKPIHLKNLRKKQNARAYKKRRSKVLAKHNANGDVWGYYRIVLTKNHKQTKELSSSWWMLTAYDKFNKYIEENRKGVICEKLIAQSSLQDGDDVKYEILLLKKINPEEDDGVREIRDKNGRFVENRIANNNKYAIIAKDDWYVPETYNVYGYNPVTDRKTGRWIFDNIVNSNCTRDNFKNIFICDNKLIIQYNSDLDFVICKTKDECLRLYNGLMNETDKNNKNILYSSFISENRKSWLYDQLENKTGWDRNVLYKKKG